MRDAFKGYVPLAATYGQVGQLEPDTLLGGLEDDDDEDQFFDASGAASHPLCLVRLPRLLYRPQCPGGAGLSDSDDEFDPRNV